jgi:rhamnosyltransferase
VTDPQAAAAPSHSVCAVLVSYCPDEAALRAELDAVLPQVAATLVVDNASTPALSPETTTGAEVMVLAQNVGLAEAQNRGIAWARERGYEYVLLLDDDSRPEPDMVTQLVVAHRELSRTVRVGAVGPRYRDLREHADAPFVRVKFPRSDLLHCEASGAPIECDFLISSGALIPLAVLDDVGDMLSGFFIDNVDLEWSFRVRSHGYRLYGVCAAVMQHALGDERLRLPGGRAQVVHSPSRLYYMTRNRIMLYRMPHTPAVWTWQDLLRLPIKLAIFSLLVPPRRRNARYMLRGVLDGLRRRSGPCPIGGSPKRDDLQP